MHAIHSTFFDPYPVAAITLAAVLAISLSVVVVLRARRERGEREVVCAHRTAAGCSQRIGKRCAAAFGASRGFTLAELMITVAIVAILATIALPTYREHVRSSRRAEAQAFLMAIASRQQQFLMDTRAYAGALSAINIPTPTNVSAAYDVTLAAAGGPPPTFSITATPKVGSDQTRERCGVLAIDQTGAKTPTSSRCW